MVGALRREKRVQKLSLKAFVEEFKKIKSDRWGLKMTLDNPYEVKIDEID